VDVRHDFSRTYLVNSNEADLDTIEKVFIELEGEAREVLQKEGLGEDKVELIRNMDLRYIGQWRSLSVEVPKPIQSLEHALEIFHQEHERQFSWSNRDQTVEIYGLRITAIGKVNKPVFIKNGQPASGEVKPRSMRRVFFERAGGFVDTPVYRRADLPAGTVLKGPAVIEQLDTTTVIPTKVKASIDEYLNIILDMRD
jgi:N-methylhydantoinase A